MIIYLVTFLVVYITWRIHKAIRQDPLENYSKTTVPVIRNSFNLASLSPGKFCFSQIKVQPLNVIKLSRINGFVKIAFVTDSSQRLQEFPFNCIESCRLPTLKGISIVQINLFLKNFFQQNKCMPSVVNVPKRLKCLISTTSFRG